MIRNENSSVIQLSRYKCQWQPVCCIGNSSNRLTPAQLQGSGGGWQTAALSVVISKGAKMPFQRQLGMAHWRGKVTSLAKVRHSPGVPHDASTSACSTKTINPTQCKEKKKKYSIGEAERHSSFPEHKTSHLSTRRCRPCSESPGHQLATATAAMPGNSWRAVNGLSHLSTVHELHKRTLRTDYSTVWTLKWSPCHGSHMCDVGVGMYIW